MVGGMKHGIYRFERCLTKNEVFDSCRLGVDKYSTKDIASTGQQLDQTWHNTLTRLIFARFPDARHGPEIILKKRPQ